MWGLIFTAGAVIVLALFPAVRCAVFHPLHVLYYGTLDTFDYIRRKQYNLCHTGDLDIYCGYFGSGKTLSLVHKVTGLYEHYDGKTVWCPRRKKFVTQRVLILSNVALTVPYEPLRSLAQVVAASKVNQDYDDEHDTLTITIACQLYREFLILLVIRNSELSGTWFVIPFVPFSYKNKFPITFCLFLIFPNDDI